MNLQRCEKGHYYDADKFVSCPHCSGGAAAVSDETVSVRDQDDAKTMALNMMDGVQPGSTASNTASKENYRSDNYMNMSQGTAVSQGAMVNQGSSYNQGTMTNLSSLAGAVSQIQNSQLPVDDDDEGKTVRYYATEDGIEPVVGWLVCIHGKERGMSFNLKNGKNFIGRSPKMDVVLKDDRVSREKHAIVVYEPMKRIFLTQPGDSSELFYLNDDVVLNSVILKQNDILTIGETKLMFVPFCSQSFGWDEES